MNIGKIKKRAKKLLEHKVFSTAWLNMVVVCFVFVAIETTLGLGSMGLLSLLLAGPIAYSLQKMYLTFAREGRSSFSYKEFGAGITDDLSGSILLGLVKSVLIALWSLLLIVPGIIKAYSYSMAMYLKILKPDLDWKTCIDESIRLTNGKKGKLFLLDLSFIGWYLLGLLCFGIGVLWVKAYNITARTIMFDKIMKDEMKASRNSEASESEEETADNSDNAQNENSSVELGEEIQAEAVFVENEAEAQKETETVVKKKRTTKVVKDDAE